MLRASAARGPGPLTEIWTLGPVLPAEGAVGIRVPLAPLATVEYELALLPIHRARLGRNGLHIHRARVGTGLVVHRREELHLQGQGEGPGRGQYVVEKGYAFSRNRE